MVARGLELPDPGACPRPGRGAPCEPPARGAREPEPDPRHFVDDEQGYWAWIRRNPRGYVVNCARRPSASYLMLHRADCSSISSDPPGHFTDRDYVKVCSTEKWRLSAWARNEVGGRLQSCEMCAPD